MKSKLQFIDGGWEAVIREAMVADRTALRIICPFIKLRAAERLLAGKRPDLIQVITRFHLGEMCDGVNDTKALRLLLSNGATIRGVRHLHAKLYLFGSKRAIVASANLTDAALLRNHEFGFVSSDSGVIQSCMNYFDSLWTRVSHNLNLARLEDWERRIERVWVAGARLPLVSSLPDEGANIGLVPPEVISSPHVQDAPQSFVKFFGTSNDRDEISTKVFHEVRRTGCHWACCYPKGKRPRQVQKDAVMFLGRLVKPNDIIIFGRAIACNHVPGRDDATKEEIKQIPFKANWPHYIRVHHPEFVAGTFENGISLRWLETELKSDSFVSTQNNIRDESGNTNPRHAYRQQPSVQLTKEAFEWLNHRLEQAFAKHGKLTPADLQQLDGPDVRDDSVSLPPTEARPLLRALSDALNNDALEVTNPETFPSYKDILTAMGIIPWEGRLGPQFSQQGGKALNEWLREQKLPALTGLVVNRGSSRPGGDYFRSNGREPDDFVWWIEQMRQSKTIDWSPYLS